MRADISLIMLTLAAIPCMSSAEDPVYFADPNLKAAVEAELRVTDPTPADMLALTSLSAHESGISSLAGLESAANLGVLGLCRNQISDISPLAGLTKLRVLKIFSNEIVDISPLVGLTDLEWIDFYDNQISEITVLSRLTRLERVELADNKISDISPLSELKSLELLVLHHNQIIDLSPLSGLTSLQVLSLVENQISDISPLSGLTGLKNLTLHSNQISDISPLSGLTNLEQTLWLGDNNISDISSLSGLTNLRELSLSANQVSDISALSGLLSLERLYLYYNPIRDLSPLAELTNLQIAGITHNQVSDISPLSGLTNLQYLYLRNNRISDLSPLCGLADLQAVYVQENPLGFDAYTVDIPLLESNGATVYYDPLVWRTLITGSTAGGFVAEPGEGSLDCTNLTIVNTNAVAALGYCFAYWTGTAVDAGKVADPTASGTSVTMMGNYTLDANFEPRRLTIYVDDDAANDLGPDDPGISDPDEDGSTEHPYDTIQEAIDMAQNGETVLVCPGIYQEEIEFLGKAITVQGVAAAEGIAVLENPGGIAASFSYGEGPDSVLTNFVMANSAVAIFVAGSSPTIRNITFARNGYGVGTYNQARPDISNCIFRANDYGDLYQCHARYSCIEGPGEGNIDADPLFVDAENGDYHLLSEYGRHQPDSNAWVRDEVTSPCIDAGDLTIKKYDEPMPNGGIINMGAYGGTAYASKSK